MSKHDYSQYSKHKKQNNVADTQPDVVIPEETVETISLPETVMGTVVNCNKLNVRAKPSITAEVVCVLDEKTEVEVDVEKSSSDWLSVCIATGVEGYCMRQFIDARL